MQLLKRSMNQCFIIAVVAIWGVAMSFTCFQLYTHFIFFINTKFIFASATARLAFKYQIEHVSKRMKLKKRIFRPTISKRIMQRN